MVDTTFFPVFLGNVSRGEREGQGLSNGKCPSIQGNFGRLHNHSVCANSEVTPTFIACFHFGAFPLCVISLLTVFLFFADVDSNAHPFGHDEMPAVDSDYEV